MTNQIDLQGASGVIYRYRLVEDSAPKTPVAGNFVCVSRREGAPVVVYVGAADNLAVEASERWIEAASRHAATHLYTRLNVGLAARDQEAADLVEALRPAMNH